MRCALLLVVVLLLLLAGAAEARAGTERLPTPRTVAAPRQTVGGALPLQPSVPINPRRSAAFGAVIVAVCCCSVMDRELQRHARFQLPLSLLFLDVNKSSRSTTR